MPTVFSSRERRKDFQLNWDGWMHAITKRDLMRGRRSMGRSLQTLERVMDDEREGGRAGWLASDQREHPLSATERGMSSDKLSHEDVIGSFFRGCVASLVVARLAAIQTRVSAAPTTHCTTNVEHRTFFLVTCS